MDQQDYKNIGMTQQSSMKEKVQAVNAKEQMNKKNQPKTTNNINVQKSDSVGGGSSSTPSTKGNWRMGNFEESPLLPQPGGLGN